MPGFVDFYAENSPDALFAIWESTTSQDGLFRLTYPEFAKATHRVAHMLRPGRTGEDGEVVAIVIHTDSVLYCALLMGCIRAGFVVRRHLASLRGASHVALAVPNVAQELYR